MLSSSASYLVRRARTWIVRRISSARPTTGSSLPFFASSVRSRVYLERALGPSILRPRCAVHDKAPRPTATCGRCAAKRADVKPGTARRA